MGFIILFAGSFWVLFLGLLGISDSTKDRLSYLIAALAFLVVMTVTIPVSVACYAKSRIKCCKTQPDSVESNPGETSTSESRSQFPGNASEVRRDRRPRNSHEFELPPSLGEQSLSRSSTPSQPSGSSEVRRDRRPHE